MSLDVATEPPFDASKLSRQLARAGWACFVMLVFTASADQLQSTLNASPYGWAHLIVADVAGVNVALFGYSYLGLRRYLMWHKFTRPRLLLEAVGWFAIAFGLLAIVLVSLSGLLVPSPSVTPAATERDSLYSLAGLVFALPGVIIGVMILLGPLRLFGLKHVFGLSLIVAAVVPSSIPYVSTVSWSVQFVALGIILLRAADDVKA